MTKQKNKFRAYMNGWRYFKDMKTAGDYAINLYRRKRVLIGIVEVKQLSLRASK